MSRQQIENRYYLPSVTESFEANKNLPPLTADYRLGNLCNCQCRMCHPKASLKWVKDYNNTHPASAHFSAEELLRVQKMDWFYQDELVKDLESKLPSLQHLHFAGGEPLLIPQMEKMLRLAVDSGHASHITLAYNTNLTVLPPKVLELWKHFRGVKLLCSIDAYGILNDYIRTHSNFSIIDKNLRELDRRYEELHLEEVLISTTVQATNILKIDELVHYLATEFKHIVPFPNLINLYYPSNLRSQILPAQIKKRAEEKLKRLKNIELPQNKSYLLHAVDEVINFMNEKDLGNLWPDFLQYNDRLDKIHGESLLKTIPELFVP